MGSSMEVIKQLSSSRLHRQFGNKSPVVSRRFGDAQETACSRVNDAVLVPVGTSCYTCLQKIITENNAGGFDTPEVVALSVKAV